MAKVPLTEAGVETKLKELYALPQKDLNVEALNIATDLKKWIEETFSLTTDEQNYLDSASDEFFRFTSGVIYAGVKNKIPIKFKPPRSIKASKRFDVKTKLDANYDWTGEELLKDTEISLEIYYE